MKSGQGKSAKGGQREAALTTREATTKMLSHVERPGRGVAGSRSGAPGVGARACEPATHKGVRSDGWVVLTDLRRVLCQRCERAGLGKLWRRAAWCEADSRGRVMVAFHEALVAREALYGSVRDRGEPCARGRVRIRQPPVGMIVQRRD